MLGTNIFGQVLSAMAGYAPGSLIGPAYGATYILAKTENTTWERHIEEDAWVAAAEARAVVSWRRCLLRA